MSVARKKARQIFRKTSISYPLIRTRTSTYQGVKMFLLFKIWHALFSSNSRSEVRPIFVLLPTVYSKSQEYLFQLLKE